MSEDVKVGTVQLVKVQASPLVIRYEVWKRVRWLFFWSRWKRVFHSFSESEASRRYINTAWEMKPYRERITVLSQKHPPGPSSPSGELSLESKP
jgi:hypothetical protein